MKTRKEILEALSKGEIDVAEARHKILLGIDKNEKATGCIGIPSNRPPQTEYGSAKGLEALRLELSVSLAAALYLNPSEIDRDRNFKEMGLDSIVGVEWVNIIKKQYSIKISATKVYDYPTVHEFSKYIYEILKSTGKLPSSKSKEFSERIGEGDIKICQSNENNSAINKNNSPGSIAIIGAAGRYPGAANLEQFWENLKSGNDAIREIPSDRWNINDYYDPDRSKPGKIYSKWLGCLDDIDRFDASFFKISAAEAKVMDPQYRIYLEIAYQAFENAGYSAQSLENKKCGVYMGVMNSEYVHLLNDHQKQSLNTGNSHSIAAARISYFLNLKGPAIPIDTACSSSLVATHLACQALRNGEIEMALVGGVTLYLTPASFIGMCAAGMLSPEGQCKSFDNEANGFVPGEGAGAIVLKRLEDAQRDHDAILGVILGSGINQDGRTNGITAPSVQSQIELERDVYNRFGINPETIDYVEAHGTGTKLGDPVELEALATVFNEYTERRHFCGLGSVKSNIGHTSAAAGVAGIQKILLCFQHRTLVPSLHFNEANTHCDFENSAFYVNTETKPWLSRIDTPRRAAVSSMGFSGTNAHLIIEEYIKSSQSDPSQDQRDLYPIVISAKSEACLLHTARNLRNYIRSNSKVSTLRDISYTLQIGRDAMEERLGFVVGSIEDLIIKLDLFLGGKPDESIHRGSVRRVRGRLAVFDPDETLARDIDQWVQHRRWIPILNSWVTGLKFDWNRIYSASRPYRVNLPPYPFEDQRYWVTRSDDRAAREVNCDLESGVTAASIAKPTALRTPQKPTGLSLFDPRDQAWISPEIVGSSRKALGISLRPLVISTSSDKNSSEVELCVLGSGIYSIRISHASTDGSMTEGLVARLECHFLAIQKKPDAKVILIEGGSPYFFAGNINNDFKLLRQSFARLCTDCELPVVAVMKGAARGSGFLLGCLCDFMICSEEAEYECGPLKDSDGLEILNVRYSSTAALAACTTGQVYTGRDLNQIGVFCPVLPASDIDAFALSFAKEIAQAPREAIVCLKKHFCLNKTSTELASKYYIKSGAKMELESLKSTTINKSPSIESTLLNLDTDVVKMEVFKDGVVLITLCDEKNKNTFSEELTRGLIDSFNRVRRSQDFKVVVLTGFGNYFACGGTKAALLAIQEGNAKFTDRNISGLPLECEIPVIAAMQGHAVGAGWAMGFYCDHIFLSAESTYHSPYMRYGFTPGAGATFILPARLGMDLGREVLFTAREYKGHELKQRGISIPVLPRAEVVAHALKLAHEIALAPRDRLIQEKADQRQSLREVFETICKSEILLHAKTFVGNPEVRDRIERSFGTGSALAIEKDIVPEARDKHQTEINDEVILASVISTLRDTLASELHTKPEFIEDETPFIEMGLDSINNVTWVRGLNQKYRLSIGATEVYNYPTIRAFSNYIFKYIKSSRHYYIEKREEFDNSTSSIVKQQPSMNDIDGQRTRQEETEDARPTRSKQIEPLRTQDIAVIGMSGQFPKAKNLDEFWDNLVHGRDCISSVPASRWAIEDFYDANPQAPGKTYCKWMGVLEDVDKFDPLFFNISPLEAESMDPQQRLFLESCWSCIEDAGYDPMGLSGYRCGVFAGCGPGDYGLSVNASGMDASSMMGGSMAILSARISYLLNLQGPCLALDTACSSSLVAIATACDSLVLGSSDLALAGGVAVMCGPSMHIMTSKAGMLSPDGRCFTFDQRANGFVPGEGVGVVLLKRLADAQRDGDPIHGVIRGWGVNQDGKTNGITAPSGDSQSRLEREVYERFGLNPEDIQLLETHGTGTRLGDPIEVEGLKSAFRGFTSRQNFCALGALKSNVGHLLAASGVAGFIKILLALKHKQLPPTIQFQKLNEHIQLETSPFYINTECREWKYPSRGPRRAAVNSFGFSGTNAHIVVDEYPEVIPERRNYPGSVIVVMSAKNQERLRNLVQNLVRYIETTEKRYPGWLHDIAYTLQVGRTSMAERLGLVVGSLEELIQKLKEFLSGDNSSGVLTGRSRRNFQQAGADANDNNIIRPIDEWIASKNYLKILEMWVGGYDFDWNRLYTQDRPRRVGLPSYPFARDRYWRESGTQETEAVKKSEPELPEGEFSLYRPVWQDFPTDLEAASTKFGFHFVFANGFDQKQFELIEQQLKGSKCIRLYSQASTLAGRYSEMAVFVFEKIREILLQRPKDKVLIQIIISSRGEEGLAAAFLSLLKTANHENPRMVGHVVIVEADEEFHRVLTDVNKAQSGSYIRIQNGKQKIRVWLDLPHEPKSIAHPWREGGVYLITGGAGGLGLIFAREIVAKVKRPKLILVGRSILDVRTKNILTELCNRGADIQYRQIDVGDWDSVRGLVDSIRAEFGALHGILHAAGVNKANLLHKKKTSEFVEVLSSKVTGTENLDRAIGTASLDLFILFGSIAGVTGNAGQVDYGAANAFLDAFALIRSKRVESKLCHGRTLAVDWPFWKEGRIGIEAATEALKNGHPGIVSLATSRGIQAFYTALASPEPQVAVALNGTLETKTTSFISVSEVTNTGASLTEPTLLLARTVQKLKGLFSQTLKLPEDQIDSEEPLESYGIDSIIVGHLNVKLVDVFPEISKSVMFEVRNIRQLAETLVAEYRHQCELWAHVPVEEITVSSNEHAKVKVKEKVVESLHAKTSLEIRSNISFNENEKNAEEPIAIIGISGRYPQAASIEAYWENLKSGKDCITEIPSERWLIDQFYHPEPDEAVKLGLSYSKWGGFIDGFAEFDPLFFNISHLEALGIDPQERLFLQATWEVLESAGYTRAYLNEKFDGDVGVFAGVTKTGFDQYLAPWRLQGEIATPYTSFASIANRVSYFLNLKGPSMPIDTMCSSSLTAIHEACEQLRRGRCQMAIAGGVNLYLHPSSYVGLSAARMLSRDGRCRSFGAGGNGFVPGEGVGVVLLKPLTKALADGDVIHAIIRGTSVNHGGKTNGYSVPNPLAQRDVIRDALVRSGVDSRLVSYIEAHGTGTELGDPIEITGLTQAFAQDTSDLGFCAVGSSKSNLGHLEAAAGIAGLTKIVLQMRHKMLVPSIHSDVVNPRIEFSKTPFFLQRQLTGWIRPTVESNGKNIEVPRIAGISSFGAGGANAHVVLEEPPEPPAVTNPCEGPVLVVLSAKTAESLHAYAQKLIDYLEKDSAGDGINLHDLAFTLQVGREAMEERLAWVVDSVVDLGKNLKAFLASSAPAGTYFRGRVHRYTDRQKEFYGDEDMAETIYAWMRKGKLSRIADLWVQGVPLNWFKLYERKQPRRIVLPTYPFAKERLWIDQKPTHSTQKYPDADNRILLHPLVHENTSDITGIRFSSTYCGREYFISDHVVEETPLLPGVAYLEMGLFAVKQATGVSSECAVIRNIVWATPITSKDCGKPVHIRVIPQTGNEFSISIETHAVAEGAITRSQSLVVLPVESEPITLDLQGLQNATKARRFSGQECYTRFTTLGMNYGPSYQGIQEVSIGEGQALARLVLPRSLTGSMPAYLLHPSLLDSALQVCGARWLLERGADSKHTETFVPYALDEVEVFARCPTQVWAWVHSANEANTGKLDIDLCDETGRVCVALRGLSFRRFESVSKQNQHQDVVLMTPNWVPYEPPQNTQVEPFQNTFVLLCGIDSKTYKSIETEHPEICVVPLICDNSRLKEAFESVATQVFNFIQRRLELGASQSRQLLQIVIPSGSEGQLLGGLAGLLKTLRAEHPSFFGQLITFDLNHSKPALIDVLKKCSYCPENVQIRTMGESLEVIQWKELISEASSQKYPWKSKGVYLITGGNGGLGLVFAEAIAKQAPGATIVICGRSELDAEKRKKVSNIAENGSVIAYKTADVSRWADVQKLISTIQDEYGCLNGILHAAGVINDRLIINKTERQFKAVLDPKVAGTIHLDQATKDIGLDFFILFSAGAGVFGNSGQVDYATANAFLDEFAEYRSRLVASGIRHGQTLSIDWPLWADGGMTIGEEGVAVMRRKLGLTPMISENGVAALVQAFASKRNQVLVMSGDGYRLKSLLNRQQIPHQVQPESFNRVPDFEVEEQVVEFLRQLISVALRIPVNRIQQDGLLSELGIDSIVVMNLTNRLEESLGSLPKTLFFEHQTLRDLARYFSKKHSDKINSMLSANKTANSPNAGSKPEQNAEQPRKEKSFRLQQPRSNSKKPLDIAIIGVSGRYPKSGNIDEYWSVLRDGRDCITEIPQERWDWRDYYSDNPGQTSDHTSKWGGFIHGVDAFDPKFFNISPKIASYIDPQERLILEEAWKALEDAGYRREDLQVQRGDDVWSPVGVYIGAMYGEYQLYGAESSLMGKRLGFAGNLASIANRLSYFLNAGGPSMMVDTMCSSSLSCIHLACQDLVSGRIQYGIAGGVNLTIHPNKYLMLSGGQFLSPGGRCESFGEGGAGYIPSEGVGVVILKRLEDAERDGDHIYGVIKGSAVNHGGRTNGYSVPSPKAQERVISEALEEACIVPGAVSYIEAHGTGTKLGDPIEIAGLANAFGTKVLGHKCWIGSAKSNIGHCEAAAGIAGLTKVLLQMKHQKIVPSLHSQVLNPYIDFSETPFQVNQTLREWEQPLVDGVPQPRIAGISSFGAGGANAHLIIKEYVKSETKVPIQQPIPSPQVSLEPVVILISAKSKHRLAEAVGQLRNHLLMLEPSDAETLNNLAYTLQVGREAMEERFGVVVTSIRQLIVQLSEFLQGQLTGQWMRGRVDGEVLSSDPNNYKKEVSGGVAKPTTASSASELLKDWITGKQVDWKRFYIGKRPSRLSLPTYPFEQERFWIEADTKRYSAQWQIKDSADVIQKQSLIVVETGRLWHGTIPSPYKPRNVVLLPLSPSDSSFRNDNSGDEKTVSIDKKAVDAPELEIGSSVPQIPSKVDSRETIESRLLASLASALFLEPHEVSQDKPFLELGLDSIVGVEWVKSINKEYGLSLSASEVYEHSSVRKFAAHVHQIISKTNGYLVGTAESVQTTKNKPIATDSIRKTVAELPLDSATVPSAPVIGTDAARASISTKNTDIAIVGMSGQFPGAQSLDEYWELLKSGQSVFREPPAERDWQNWPKPFEFAESPISDAPNLGGFLEKADCFDPLFFNISPKEAMTLDPGERLFLQESWNALEDAGIVPAEIAGRPWGVFCGNGGDYSLRIKEVLGYSPHVTLAQVSSRVSYTFDLTGPSQSVDAGCASALLAIAQACDHLVMGKCEAALAGGVLIHSTPNLIFSANQVNLLSKSGKVARALDGTASGMVPSEAVGVVVLKRLADALAAGDRIHGVIEGWGNNHNGRTQGMVQPSLKSQQALFSEVYSRYNIDPDGISFVEANAAGLPMADTTEVLALTRAFREKTERTQFCALGSVENNVGHAFHASGMCHLMKVLLSLRNREIPGTPHVDSTDAKMAIESSPFIVHRSTIPWKVDNTQRRRAAVSSFGATGANVHLVLSESPGFGNLAQRVRNASEKPVLIVLSAKTEQGMKQRCRDLARQIHHLLLEEGVELQRLSANLLLRRSHFENRCAFVVYDADSLRLRLEEVVNGMSVVDGFVGVVDSVPRLLPALTQFANDKIKSLKAQTVISKEELLILADLFVQGVSLDLRDLFSTREKTPLSLRPYPFEKRRCWIELPKKLALHHSDPCEAVSAVQKNIDSPSLVQKALIGMIVEVTGLSSDEIDIESSLSQYGVDSLIAMRLLNRVNARYGGGFDPALLLSGSISSIAREIVRQGAGARNSPEIKSEGAWVRPNFVDSSSIQIEQTASVADAASGAKQLENLIRNGVGVWAESDRLHFEYFEETQTRESLCRLIPDPGALFAILEKGKRYYPVSEMQRFSLHESETNKRTTLNLSQGFWIDYPVNQEALQAALNDIAQRHSIFRTGASPCGSQWMQVVHDHLTLEYREMVWRGVESSEHFEAELVQFQKQLNRKVFDVKQAPMLELYFIHNEKSLGSIFLSTHHFHADGFTLYFLQQELHARYLAHQRKEPYESSIPAAEYVHFALTQFNPERTAITQYWINKLQGKRPQRRLCDRSEFLEEGVRGLGVFELEISASMLDQLCEFNRRNRTTLTQLVTSSLAVLLFKLTGSSHPIQMVYNLRDRVEFESMFGDFSSSVPMILSIDGKSTWSDVLGAYEDAALDIQRRGHFDFSSILKIGDQGSGSGLFADVAVDSNDRDTFGEVTPFAQRLIDLTMEGRPPVAPLLVCVVRTHGKLTVPILYDQSCFSLRSIELISESLISLLGQLQTDKGQTVQNASVKDELNTRLGFSAMNA